MTGVIVRGAWCIPLWMEYTGRIGLDWNGMERNALLFDALTPCISSLSGRGIMAAL